MNELIFILYILCFSFLLRFFYSLQRKVFKKNYYSFYELITGLPQNLSFNQLFTIRFLPPFLITFLAYFLLNNYFHYNFLVYSAVGVIASLTNIIPSIVDIKTYKGKDTNKLLIKSRINSLYVIYFFYFLSFLLISGLGAYFSSLFPNLRFIELLPSKQGIIDGLWVATIIVILNKFNKPLL